MASSLPSFIELMASLGLDNNNPNPPRITTTRSRSSSLSSHDSPLSSTVDLSKDPDRRLSSSRLRAVRFSPYIAQTSSARQCSSTSLTEDPEQDRRATSPSSSSPARNKPCPLLSPMTSRELHATTPISSYARRRTPQNSPTAPTFPHRVHTDRPETIVLPSLLPAPISH